MGMIRNLVITLFRRAGHPAITTAIDLLSNNLDQLLSLVLSLIADVRDLRENKIPACESMQGHSIAMPLHYRYVIYLQLPVCSPLSRT
jgi:hypothetical protein